MNIELMPEDEVRADAEAKAAAQEQLRRCKYRYIPDAKTLAKLFHFVRLCKEWSEDPSLEATMLYDLGRMDGIRQERQRRAKRGGGDRGKN